MKLLIVSKSPHVLIAKHFFNARSVTTLLRFDVSYLYKEFIRTLSLGVHD